MEALRKIQLENQTKTCLFCEREVIGRSDKKYCTTTCKHKAWEIRQGFEPLKTYNTRQDQNISPTVLRVIRGGMFPTSKIEILIDSFWSFCHATLWKNQIFSKIEVLEFKKMICQHFMKFNDLDTAFKQLVERVCLAKRYVTRRQDRYIAKPMDWLNINYRNGLAGTESWYKSVSDQRKTVPHYNEGISTLARAVLSWCEQKNILDILNYRTELIKQKQFDLLQIYINAIIHIQYLNF